MSQPTVAVFDVLRMAEDTPKHGLFAIKTLPGHQKLFFGIKKEDPNSGVFCSLWTSLEDAQYYVSKSILPNKVSTLLFEFDVNCDPLVPLMAPCTEGFTGFGAEEGFEGNVKRFLEAVDGERVSLKGYYGGVVGVGVGKDEGGGIVRLLLGWESVEAHGEAKAVEEGVILRNIHELRSLRREVELFHVEFREV
ncbi:hypothetical protein QBC34DRAFT_397631 [Podospora aff. communis PSN243]|uniref:ABM domain-containing protein n=1 Tax=Podospora aff. communis PSN243 TaxID=3040156 RepID=A0AAV9GYA9_9PEZI|nr:hypothetical protein QBC34DRAFT_397631 [Podospora aff. communis PSN243]